MSDRPPAPVSIIWAGAALPGDDVPQVDFAVAVQGTRIVAVGPRGLLRERFPAAPAEGGAELLMLPGLVNAHDHGRAVGALPLGAADDLLELWLPGLWALPAIDPELAALWESAQLLRGGVTATAHSHNPRDWARMAEESAASIRGYRAAGLRVAFHPPIVDQNRLVYDGREALLASLPPDALAAAAQFDGPPPLPADEYLALCDELIRSFHDPHEHTVHVQVSPAGPQWCSDELIAGCVALARRRATRVQMHALETRYQRAYARRRWGIGTLAHLDELGALGPWLTLAHCVWLEPGDPELLARRGAGVAHSPSSNLRLRSGVAPLPELLAAGVALGVGLDGLALDDDQDFLRELRLAWTLANRASADAMPIAADVLLYLGTAGGADITFGTTAQLGRLTPGAPADLVLIDAARLRGVWSDPQLDPAALLLRRGSRAQVRHVLAGGRWVVRDGRCLTVDEAAVAAELGAQLDAQLRDPARRAVREAARALAPHLRGHYAAWEG